MKKVLFASLLATILWGLTLRADQEASNIIYVKSSTYGRCYAKSVPDDYWGAKGKTLVYLVKKEKDDLLFTLPWYTQQIYLQCNMVKDGKSGASVVRIGPWPRGNEPSKEELALSFYFNDRLLKSYSTLDIAGKKSNALVSVSHYRVIKLIKGYRWVDSNDYAFDIETVDGRLLSFNATTGELIQ